MKKLTFLTLALFASLSLTVAVLGAPRNTPETPGTYTIAIAGEALEAGYLAGIATADGKFYHATNGVAMRIIGRVEQSVPAGAQAIVKRGTFLWTPAATNYTDAVIGAPAYATAAAHSVATAGSGAITNLAGIIIGREADGGLWVRSGY